VNLYIVFVSTDSIMKRSISIPKPMKYLVGLTSAPTIQIPYKMIVLVRSTILLLLWPLLGQTA
jgi:hypothetical protein